MVGFRPTVNSTGCVWMPFLSSAESRLGGGGSSFWGRLIRALKTVHCSRILGAPLPPPSPLRFLLWEAFFYRKTSAISSLIGSRRITPAHDTRSQQQYSDSSFLFILANKFTISTRCDSNSRNQRYEYSWQHSRVPL